MDINPPGEIGQNKITVNKGENAQVYSGLKNLGLTKDEFLRNEKKHEEKVPLISKIICFIAKQTAGKKPIDIKSEPETPECNIDKTSQALIQDKPLSVEDKDRMLRELGLTKSDLNQIEKQFKEFDDKTFIKSILLIKNGGGFTSYIDFNEVNDISDEQYEKALKLIQASKNPMNISKAFKAATIDELSYSRLYEIRKNNGEYDVYTDSGEFYPEKLALLDENSFNNLIKLIPVLYYCRYIIPIASNENYYNNVQKLIDNGILKEITNYQKRYKVLYSCCEDEKITNKLCKLLNNGLSIKNSLKDSSDIYDSYNQLGELNEEQFNKALDLAKKYGVSSFENILTIAQLNDSEYCKATELLNSGVSASAYLIKKLVKLDNGIYEHIKELIQKGMDPATIGYKVETLRPDDFNRIDELVDAGVKSFSMMAETITMDEAQYTKAKKLAEAGLPGYNFINKSSLSDDEFEKELKKIKTIASQLEFDKLPKEEKELYQFNDDELNDIAEKLIKEYVDVSSKDKKSIKKLANLWLKKYITGVNALPGYEDRIIPYVLNRYESKNCAPLGRWMCIENLDEFINNFPDAGEIYQYDKMMSFAKTLDGAERFRGNNFSDSNSSMNVKFVVYPKNELTQAYDTGEGKYGNDEAVYKPNQPFKVLYKDVEHVNDHDLYTIYMQEM